MYIKELSGNEMTIARKVQSIAFNFGTDFSGPEPEESSCQTYGAFNDAGKLCSCVEVLPYKAFINGQLAQMACVGGVASLPEERGHGYVQALTYHILEQAHSQNVWGSYLDPFSHVYYRKFGYELCNTVNTVKVPLREFQSLKGTGEITQFFPDDSSHHNDSRHEIVRIYETFAADKNFMLSRSDEMWNQILSPDPYKNSRYTYYWRNEAGVAESYAILHIGTEFRANVEVIELIWTTPESLRGILAFMKTFAATFGSFVWNAPRFLNFSLLVPEPLSVAVEQNCAGMFRIVDVKKALSTLTPPEGFGEIAVSITDKFLEWNNGVFLLSWSGNGIRVEKTNAAPDFECDIQTAAQLISGYATPAELELSGRISMPSKAAVVSKLFTKKRTCITDHF